MKKHNDQDLFGMTLALLDHRSAAFRQKMLNHFESKGRYLLADIDIFPDRKNNSPVRFLRESA
ncbi:MAG: hypothetical protein M3Q16_10250 [Pseudomonadota bacterium]|nr:hypothetical protein [Pseudomonadota bacterium]